MTTYSLSSKASSENSAPDFDQQNQSDTNLVIEQQIKSQKPFMYKVFMLNDDYTPMDFVVHILQSLFGKSTEDAFSIMMNIHHNGVGLCGIFTFEVAETKAAQVINIARQYQHPLLCKIEKA